MKRGGSKFNEKPGSEFSENQHTNDFVPTVMNPEQFGSFIRSEIEKWGKVVKATGAQAN